MKRPILLIIDDEPDIRSLYTSIINRNFDFDIIQAESLESAKNILGELQPDYVVLDLHLKDGNGFDLIPALKKVNKKVKILIVTAFNHCKEKQKASEFGAVGLLSKPFETANFVEYITAMHKSEE